MAAQEELQTIAQKLRWARSQKGWSLDQVADRCRENGAPIGKATVWKLETEECVNFKRYTLQRIVKALGLNYAWVIDPTGLVKEVWADGENPENKS